MKCEETVTNWNFLFSKADEDWFRSCCNQHECFLADFCLPTLLHNIHEDISNTHRVYQYMNALNRVTIILREKNQTVEDRYMTDLLHVVVQFIDFALDVVCYACVNILDDLLHMHAVECALCRKNDKLNCKWTIKIYRLLSDDKSLTTFRLRSISKIVHYVGMGKAFLSTEFFEKLYARIGDATLSNVISTVIVEDLCFLPQRDDFHIDSIKTALIHESPSIRTATKQRLLPAILKVPRLRIWFMEYFHKLSDLPKSSPYFLESELILTRFGILYQKTVSLSYGWDDYLDRSIIVIALLSDSDEVKLTAWGLICDHPKKSRPVSAEESELAYCFMLCNCAEQSPQIRQKIFNNLEKLLCRMRDSSIHLFKHKENAEKIETYKQFLQNLKQLAFHDLTQNSANFNRRISALTLVKILFCGDSLASGDIDLRVRFEMSSWLCSADIQTLVECLDDEFQLCQEIAFFVLTTFHLGNDVFDLAEFENGVREHALSCSSSNLSSSYQLRLLCSKCPQNILSLLHEFLNKCDHILSTYDGSIIKLTKHIPYVFLVAIEDILCVYFQSYGKVSRVFQNDFREYVKRILQICYRFAEIVSPVCHSLSPEGFLPDECFTLSEMEQLHINSAQKLLVYCWRTHRCVSAIISSLVSHSRYPEELDSIALEQIGDYLWLQLTECRHCGAFESAAQAFEALCTRLWAIHRSSTTSSLISPITWLQRAICALRVDHDTSNLCSTRRSAGLPHLVSVILTTAKIGKQFPHLSDTLEVLLDCRRLKSKLEIHCVNVLKALFSNSSLAEGVLIHSEQAFRVCYEGCCATEWPVRNAHCQFFSALVQRVFGIPKTAQRSLHVQTCNKMTSFNFFSRYPSLYRIVFEHLDSIVSCLKKRSQFGTFPMLILLTHLHKSAVDLELKFPLWKFVPGVLTLMFASPIQKMRELAAAALISILDDAELTRILRIILGKISMFGEMHLHENFFDGTLNLISFMVQQNMFNETNSGQCMLQLTQLIVKRIFARFDLSVKCDNDFNLNTTLMLVKQIGTVELKQQVLKKICIVLHKSVSIYWRSVHRPIGALFADFCTDEYWTEISTKRTDINKNDDDNNLALRDIRYEAYRFLYLENRWSSKNIEEVILRDLLNDLAVCDRERHLEFIIALLMREGHRLRELNFDISREAIARCESICFKTENHLNLIRLKLMFLSATDSDEIKKVNDFIANVLAQSDDKVNRLAALQLAVDLLDKLSLDNLLETACIALKDESSEIRSYASKSLLFHLVSPCLVTQEEFSSDTLLNAEISWSFALERFPQLATRIFTAGGVKSEEKESELFNVSPANIFAESFAIYDFGKIKEILN